jgi:hypothetical protein
VSGPVVVTRVVHGRAPVAREVRSAAPLMAVLRAPLPAQGPWLTAVLNADAASGARLRPAAVVVEAGGRTEAVAFLALRRRGLRTTVTLLGDGPGPVPPGRPARRLLARDADAADLLAAGIHELLAGLRGPVTVRLAGLPLGDPTVRALAPRLPTSVVATERSLRLVDDLDEVGEAVRSRHPARLEATLPDLLAREPDPDVRRLLRSAARLHAAIGRLEVAVLPGAALLTLVEGADRWSWCGFSDVGGLRTERGSPSVTLGVPARGWP